MTVLEELLDYFRYNGIQREAGSRGAEQVLAFQDAVGRSSIPELRHAWQALDCSQRDTFTWALWTCCDPQTARDITWALVFEPRVNEQVQAALASADERANALSDEVTRLRGQLGRIQAVLHE